MNIITHSTIHFELPEHLACPKPTEERNLKRDEVRLLVTTGAGQIEHTTFTQLGAYLRAGDVLVVNTSATIASALPVLLPHGGQGRLHLSNKMNGQEWLIEIREVVGNKTVRWKNGEAGMVFQLPSAGNITLKQKFYRNQQWLDLWIADFQVEQPVNTYLAAHALPIQYEKLNNPYPLTYYQTWFSFHPGSAEMPSASRGFTTDLVNKLMNKGVILAPFLLHTGVSSLEDNETPYPEYMEINPISANLINVAKSQNRRIIAVGTTSIRAIETAANHTGKVIPYRGNTNLCIDESYTMKVADGLLTGFHEPRASHLNMLQSVGGFEHIEQAYQAAIRAGYYWHQFGDLHLILP